MNKNYIIILCLTFILSLFICTKDMINIINFQKIKSEYTKLQKEKEELENNINKINQDILYIENQYNFIETANEKNKELLNNVNIKKEEIESIKLKINSIDKKIKEQESVNKELKKYLTD